MVSSRELQFYSLPDYYSFSLTLTAPLKSYYKFEASQLLKSGDFFVRSYSLYLRKKKLQTEAGISSQKLVKLSKLNP